MRGGKPIPLKTNTDQALTQCPDVKTVIVVKRTGGEGRDESGPRCLVSRSGGEGLGRLPAPKR